MAKHEFITDDLIGEPGESIRRFSVGGIPYEIDLTDTSWCGLLDALDPYMNAGRIRSTGMSTRVDPLRTDEKEEFVAWVVTTKRTVLGTPTNADLVAFRNYERKKLREGAKVS